MGEGMTDGEWRVPVFGADGAFVCYATKPCTVVEMPYETADGDTVAEAGKLFGLDGNGLYSLRVFAVDVGKVSTADLLQYGTKRYIEPDEGRVRMYGGRLRAIAAMASELDLTAPDDWWTTV